MPAPKRGVLLRAVACSVLGLLAAAPSAAWDRATRARLTEEAVRFMPAALRLALERHRDALLRGALEPLTGEDGPAHRPAWAGGALDARIDQEAQALRRAIDRGAPFDETAARFGALAHFVADAGFPPATSAPPDPRRYRHFAQFCESRRARFPLVFYGHAEPGFPRGGFDAWARAVLERTRADDRELARAYAHAGEPPAPAAFDDRSVPFAVGSLAYSRSCTNVVRAWLAVWTQAGGDTGGTPYVAPAPQQGNSR